MKKIKLGSTEMTYVWLVLVCDRCEAKFGEVYRMAGQHPRVGEERIQSRCGQLVDRPDGGVTLHSQCSRCGAAPQTRWERIAQALDNLHPDATASGVLRIYPDVRRATVLI